MTGLFWWDQTPTYWPRDERQQYYHNGFTSKTLILMEEKRDHIKKYVHQKLSKKMKIYFLFSLIMIGIVIYEVIVTKFNPFLALGIRAIGLIGWFFISRMFQIYWHKDEQVVTSRIDRIGWIILWIYLVFSFWRHFLIGLIVPSPLVFVVTFSLVAGIMIGRFIGMWDTIMKILKKQKIV